MIRAYRDSDGEWWLDRRGAGVHPPSWRNGKERVGSLDELETEIADRIAKLLFANPGDTVGGVGRRIDTDTFWVYKEDD